MFVATAIRRITTARSKKATRRGGHWVGWGSLNCPHAAPRRVGESGNRVEQRLRVGHPGIGKQFASGSKFDHFAGVHHRNSVTVSGHDAEIVCDNDHGHAQFLADVAKKIKYLSLHGDVKGGSGFISQEHLWVAGDRHRNHYALTHASRQLVRIFSNKLFGLGQAYQLE